MKKQKSNRVLIPEFERLLKLGYMVEFVPKGLSMRPFIESGRDKVVLRLCKEPKVGMIVLARVGERFVLHRIYQINGEELVLRGDGNLTGHEICKAEDIIGYVVQIKTIRGVRRRLTKGRLWRHLPTGIKKLYLKLYRIFVVFTYDED